MNFKNTLGYLSVFVLLIAACSKDKLKNQDAKQDIPAVQNQHEIDTTTLRLKASTALQQFANITALAQLKLNDSLTRAGAASIKKQDYNITVVDANTNAPVSDADVIISAEGKVLSSKTNAQGTASFSSLLLYNVSAFIIVKEGYATTQVSRQNIASGNVKLWSIADAPNEISGTLYVESDLSNATTEKVGANVLVTASTSVIDGTAGNYSMAYAAYTSADGVYTIKLAPSANSYKFTFETITANQKLFVNYTEDDGKNTAMPATLPRLTALQTSFTVNGFNAPVPIVTTNYYLKLPADVNGRVLAFPSNYPYYYFADKNTGYVSGTVGNYQLERLYANSYNNADGVTIDPGTYIYAPNTKLDVEMVDVSGTLIKTAPLLMATTDASGKLNNYASPEGGFGYVHLKRDNANTIVPNAKGVILRASNGYFSDTNQYQLYFTKNLNTASGNVITPLTYTFSNKADKKVIDFYYGSGNTRAKKAS